MAKITGPLMSIAAHGKLAQSLIYSKRKEGNIGRGFHMPNKEPSLKQWTQRHIIGMLTAHWQVKTTAEKLVYENLAAASGLQISGFNYFIKVAQADLYTHHGLAAYWPMNETSGVTLFDYSGQNKHATIGGTIPSTIVTRTPAMQKEYGNALKFSGSANTVTFPQINLLKTFTFMIWLKPNSQFEMYGGLISLNFEFGFFYMGSSAPANQRKITFYYGPGDHFTSNLFSDNQWSHYAAVVNNGSLSHFINTIPAGTALNVPNSSFKIIGDDATGEPFKGTMDEAKLYNRAFGIDEIKKQYNLLRLGKKRQPLLIH